MNKKWIISGVSIGIISVLIIGNIISRESLLREESLVNPDNIERYMQAQVDIGPRYPGSEGSLEFKDWIFSQISDPWKIEIQNFTYMDIDIRNYFITHQDRNEWPKHLFGAHYDSRKFATSDPDNPEAPVPGANDGASGVAAILEMLRHIPKENQISTGFILFDAEDQGGNGMIGWDWIVGSEYFADQMTSEQINQTEFFLLFDMIANDELELRKEGYSDDTLNSQIWEKANNLGYSSIFVDTPTSFITDDHVPFYEMGIPVVDLIDLSYPEWHTTDDNMDNVSAENAAIVLDVVIEWMHEYYWQGSDQYNSSKISSQNFSTTTQGDLNYNLLVSSVIIMILFKNQNKT